MYYFFTRMFYFVARKCHFAKKQSQGSLLSETIVTDMDEIRLIRLIRLSRPTFLPWDAAAR
jgi:hypothetical protein